MHAWVYVTTSSGVMGYCGTAVQCDRRERLMAQRFPRSSHGFGLEEDNQFAGWLMTIQTCRK